jgi:peptidoglycan hydrolase CwlO-like protein
MTIEITILISILSVSSALFFGLKSMKRADASDIEERAKKNAEINLKLDNILATVSSMKDEMKELTSRLTKDEKDTEMLIVRFAELEKRIERLEEK